MTLTDIDRSFFETLRLKVVGLGFLPNQLSYSNVEDYNSAKIALNQSLSLQGKSIIEIFGVGSSETRGELLVSRITIDRKEIGNGSFGVGKSTIYEQYEVSGITKYRKKAFPSEKAKSITYEIRFFTNSVDMERDLINILFSVFDDSTILNVFDTYGVATTETFEVIKRNFVSIPKMSDWFETLMTLEVKDTFISPMVIVKTDIPVLSTFNLYLYPVNNKNDLQ